MKKKLTLNLMVMMIMGMMGITTKVEALPAYRRLVNQQYSTAVSCVMCHTNGGGSSINGYGKDFLRNGANLLALSRIEGKDSDKDDFSNLIELLARSNPGDALSFPDKPGDWLNNIESDAIPIEELKQGFSAAKGFTVLEGTLKPKQIDAIEKILGQPLRDEDKVPIFYFAVKETNKKVVKYGVAQFIRADEFTLCIGVNLRGKVDFVNVIKSEDKSLKNVTSYFQQFVGKDMGDAFQIGKDLQGIPKKLALSTSIAATVKKNILIVNAVFSKPEEGE